MSNALVAVAARVGGNLLPDTDRYKFRMQIRSQTSSKLYIVAWDTVEVMWKCECPGWKNARNGHRNRNCKHLRAMMPMLESAKASVGDFLNKR